MDAEFQKMSYTFCIWQFPPQQFSCSPFERSFRCLDSLVKLVVGESSPPFPCESSPNVVFATWLQTPAANTLFIQTAALFCSFQADAGCKTYAWAMDPDVCPSFSWHNICILFQLFCCFMLTCQIFWSSDLFVVSTLFQNLYI